MVSHFLDKLFVKNGNKLHIKPSDTSVKSIIQKIKVQIRNSKCTPPEALIGNLNRILR